ncbi:FAD-dependent oxidoreductase [Streptomyces spinoverrucosus]|uniref:NAD(P)/FAD-dependent oxidoreductase n=1 Tax=Streptomyces spinoverrucosus TaxID=284043 RepID=UPI0018C44D62|nr:FAD-dependent oxidoreductase [Streptomyces spinoverrucosus]MBG0856835.1 FAD-dependent oxidoreductase [Streptomyces spinoverrucosus]
MRTVTIVGASLSGLYAARELRAQGFEGRLVIVGDEAHRPYDRPPLSKDFLTGRTDETQLALTDPEETADLQAEWLLGIRARGLDPRTRTVLLDDGRAVPTDGLVIATGASARRLPGDHLTGIHTLRTLDDARALREELTRGPRRVVVIGAGFIGAETASSCAALGHRVTVIEAAPLPLLPQLGPEMAAVCAELHRRGGVELITGTGVAALRGTGAVMAVTGALGEGAVTGVAGACGAAGAMTGVAGACGAAGAVTGVAGALGAGAVTGVAEPYGEGVVTGVAGSHGWGAVTGAAGPPGSSAVAGSAGPRGSGTVTGVALTDGRTLPADIVIIGIGATPNTGWLTGSTLALHDGVLCDDGCVTSLPQVVAVGDVARVGGSRAEHWTSATEQPRVAVANLLAGRTVETVCSVPYFWSDQYGARIQFAGRRQDGDTVRIVEGDATAPDGGGFLALYEREGCTTAVLAVDRPRPFLRVRRELARGVGNVRAPSQSS